MNLKKLIFFIPISLLFLVGCEQPTKPPTESKIEHEIWINTEAECCGVKDPLNNLKWIDETFMFGEHNESPAYDYCYFLLFRNNETLKDHIVVNAFIETNCITICDCDGNIIDGGAYHLQNYQKDDEYINDIKPTMAQPCDTCEEFFRTHTLIDTIAYQIVKRIK